MKTAKQIEAFLERARKRLSESPRGSHSGKHRVAFTALRPLIEAMLGQGYTMMATWDSLREENELSMSYETFRTHCRRAGVAANAEARRTELPRSAQTPVPRLAQTPGPGSPQPPAQSRPAVSADTPQREFRHERVPRKKDIYG